MTKKVVKRKTKSEKVDITKLSIADLYALYLFVSNDGNNRGFGMTSPHAKEVVRDKQRAIETELYLRAYGYNPFEEHKLVQVHEGMKPEDIDLDRVAVYQGEDKEPQDKKPDTFVVVKNKEEEE